MERCRFRVGAGYVVIASRDRPGLRIQCLRQAITGIKRIINRTLVACRLAIHSLAEPAKLRAFQTVIGVARHLAATVSVLLQIAGEIVLKAFHIQEWISARLHSIHIVICIGGELVARVRHVQQIAVSVVSE